MQTPKEPTDLRQFVAARMDATGTSQRELARRSNIGHDKISLWLRGKCDLYGDRIHRILDALGPPRMTWPKRLPRVRPAGEDTKGA